MVSIFHMFRVIRHVICLGFLRLQSIICFSLEFDQIIFDQSRSLRYMFACLLLNRYSTLIALNNKQKTFPSLPL